MQTYKIRLQVIVTADSDGSNDAGVKASDITNSMEGLNQIYAPVGVVFLFSESGDFLKIHSTLLNRELTVLEPPNVGEDEWDHKPIFDKQSHHQARTGLAEEFPGKVVLVIHKRVALRQNKDTGNWFLKSAGGASSATAAYVNLSPTISAAQLAHEIGHYLQLPHTFVGDIETVANASGKIKKYVADGHPKSEGLKALDGDLGVVLDTPADVAGTIFVNAGFNKCDPNKILIPVIFPDSTSKTYELNPNRALVMSYFKGCPGPKTFSPEQARRVRDGLELRLRQNLISIKYSNNHKLLRGPTGTGGAISELDITLVRAGRVVTAVRDAEKELKLIAWDIASDGAEIARVGEGRGGVVGKVAACGLGMNMVATAVIDAQARLKVILWRVEENGDVERVTDETREGKIDNVAISILHYSLERNFFATVSQKIDGSLRADVWRVFANGTLRFETDNVFTTAELTNPGSAPTRLTLNSVGAASVIANYVDRSKKHRTVLWQYDDDALSRKELIMNGGDVDRLAACSVSRTVSVAVIEDKEQALKLRAYRSPSDGADLETRGKANGGVISEVDVCNLGTEMVVTGVRTAANNLKVILWGVTRTGDVIVRLTDNSAPEDFSRLAMCQTARNQFTTAMRDGEGKLKVIVWRIPLEVIVSGLSHPLPDHDGFAQPFPKSTVAKNGSQEIDLDCDLE